MRVLYVTSEAFPFIKTGGLADVAGALPKALNNIGLEVSVVMPLYSKIDEKFKSMMDFVGYYYVDLDWRHQYCGLYRLFYNEVEFYFIDNKQYFDRENIYGEGDDGERFIFYSKAVTLLPKYLSINFDIVHTNDWHCALVNVFIKDFSKGDDFYKKIKTLFTIHNLKYQGVFPSECLQMTGLSPEYFVDDGLKFYNAINFMKGGIVYSDRFNTVSGSYALEIKNEYFGEQLDGLIRAYDYKLSGIVNGIDTKLWNPANDSNIVKKYSLETIINKKQNKLAFQSQYCLPVKADVPMIVIISRLVEMKGLDLLTRILDELLQEDVQIVVLGTGDEKFENAFRHFEWKYHDKFRALIFYSNKVSHQLYAAADFILMPSLSEPCGISQLIAMRYGTIPIVRETGGLKDTVKPYSDFNKEGTGFSFSNINAHDMLYTIKLALDTYKKPEFFNIISNAMSQKLDWSDSAKAYENLYEDMIK